jgi:hypothetical protein
MSQADSVSSTVERRMDETLELIWKEAVVAY